MRTGLRILLERISDVTVIAECDNGRDSLATILKERPSVAILDINLPGLSGLDVAAVLSREDPRIGTVILTGHMDMQYILKALSADVSAFLLKNSSVPELELGIRAAASGNHYFTPAAKRLLEARTDDVLSHKELTLRHREILTLIRPMGVSHSPQIPISRFNPFEGETVYHRRYQYQSCRSH